MNVATPWLDCLLQEFFNQVCFVCMCSCIILHLVSLLSVLYSLQLFSLLCIVHSQCYRNPTVVSAFCIFSMFYIFSLFLVFCITISLYFDCTLYLLLQIFFVSVRFVLLHFFSLQHRRHSTQCCQCILCICTFLHAVLPYFFIYYFLDMKFFCWHCLCSVVTILNAFCIPAHTALDVFLTPTRFPNSALSVHFFLHTQ